MSPSLLLEKLKMIPKTYLSFADIAKLYSGKKDNLKVVLHRLVRQDKLNRLMKGYYAISVNLKQFNEYKKIIQVCKEILKDKMAREAKKGLKPRAMRAMVLGIPNVGKSTFINRLAKRMIC